MLGRCAIRVRKLRKANAVVAGLVVDSTQLDRWRFTAVSNENAIRAMGARLLETWNAHNMKAFAALFRDDAEFVNVYGMWWTGRERIHAEHEAAHATVFRRSRLSATETRVKFVRPDVASLHMLWHLTGLFLPSGQALPDRKGVLVCVLAKNAGEWRIAVAQNTDIVPAPM
jgi:uncharacterized protein (TIGR02246 family)